MDPTDTGFFEYDDNYPPMCIRDSTTTAAIPDELVDAQITDYLQESYKEGVKHEDAILPSGLSAGEAGVLYFRKLNSKRRRVEKLDLNVDLILSHVAESLRRHMDIDVTSRQYRPAFVRCLNPDVFQTKQYKRKLMQAVKTFLRDIKMTTKGYTSKLRLVMTTINARIDQMEKNNI